MNQSDAKKITTFYSDLLKKHGDHFKAGDYGSVASQLNRFNVLLAFGKFEGKSVLDVGCGKGDFYGFLKKQGLHVDYTGIEIAPDVAALAQKKYPDAHIIIDNFETHAFDRQYDIVITSGTFDFKVSDHATYLQKSITKMYELAIQGVTFNLTSIYLDKGYENDYTYYAQPEEIFRYCKKLCRFVTLRHDYAPNDFTMDLYKTPEFGY